MFAHRSRLIKGLLTLVCAFAAIAVTACGGDDDPPADIAAGMESTDDATANADPGDLEVIEGWSEALADGDVEGAAGYFAIPSTAVNGPVAIEIESRRDAVAFNESLPCGAEVISAETDGDVTVATFVLSDRPGGDCGSGSGGEASTAFEITDGEIVDWGRVVPTGEPGDPEAPAAPAPGDPV